MVAEDAVAAAVATEMLEVATQSAPSSAPSTAMCSLPTPLKRAIKARRQSMKQDAGMVAEDAVAAAVATKMLFYANVVNGDGVGLFRNVSCVTSLSGSSIVSGMEVVSSAPKNNRRGVSKKQQKFPNFELRKGSAVIIQNEPHVEEIMEEALAILCDK